MDDDLLEKVHDVAMLELEKEKNDICRVREPFRSLIIVYSAQGIIDNGGLKYFFETDYPGNPPYKYFIDAYKRTGSIEGSTCLQDAVNSFPFDEPHLNGDLRNKFMDENWEEEDFCVSIWTDLLCGNEKVWINLKRYVGLYPDEFGLDGLMQSISGNVLRRKLRLQEILRSISSAMAEALGS